MSLLSLCQTEAMDIPKMMTLLIEIPHLPKGNEKGNIKYCERG